MADMNMLSRNHSASGIGRSDHDSEEKAETEVVTDTPGMNGGLPQAVHPGDGSLPGVDELSDGVVILLVANKDTDKRGVVESLTKSGSWKTQKAAIDSEGKGVRILTCESPAHVIVDTTSLVNVQGRSPLAIGRRWISRNCLRRLLSGKDVVVVCVVTCRVRKTCSRDMFACSNCWVDVFGLIFRQHKAAILVLVNKEDEAVPQETKEAVARFVLDHGLSPKNITYPTLKGGEDSVSNVIEKCIRQRKGPQDRRSPWIEPLRKVSERLDLATDGKRPPRWKSCLQCNHEQPDTDYSHRTVMPFTINDALSQKYEALTQAEKVKNYKALSDTEKFGSWGPERVILLGRTGSGKSTLAQMLTLGKLDKENEMFAPSAGVRGATIRVQFGVGRGWYVLDTPGFGEPKEEESTISTAQVEAKIKAYVRAVEGTFSHYIYVWKRGRTDALDHALWKFFTILFGEEIKRQFSVVVSDADEDWVNMNIASLKACFTGCESFICAEFPPIDDEDEEIETDNEDHRAQSLSELEQKLAVLNRVDMICKYGRSAWTNLRMETERTELDLGIERSELVNFRTRGASMMFVCSSISQRPFYELTNMLRVNDKISLLPG